MDAPNEQDRIVIHANYELFVFLITLLSVANSVLWLLLSQPEARQVVVASDIFISMFLMVDAFYRLLRAPYRRRFLFGYYGWLAFVGSLPVPGLRLLRLLYIWIVIRKLRRPDYALASRIVIEKRAQSALMIAFFMALLVLEVGGILVLSVEGDAFGANIKTASDAVWWGYVTVATVGYGDKYPVTNAGRVVGVFMMTIGVGLFSVVTGFLADWFRAPRTAKEREQLTPLSATPDEPRAKLAEIRRLLEEQELAYRKSTAELKARLVEIEKTLPQS